MLTWQGGQAGHLADGGATQRWTCGRSPKSKSGMTAGAHRKIVCVCSAIHSAHIPHGTSFLTSTSMKNSIIIYPYFLHIRSCDSTRNWRLVISPFCTFLWQWHPKLTIIRFHPLPPPAIPSFYPIYRLLVAVIAARLHQALYIFAAAYKSLDEEEAQRRRRPGPLARFVAAGDRFWKEWAAPSRGPKHPL